MTAIDFAALRRRVLRRLYRRVVPASVREALALESEIAAREIEPRALEAPHRRRVAVVAPHADDETLGCGGTLALAARAGSVVRAVFVTDGSKGYPSTAVAPGADRAAYEGRLVVLRQHEARAAGARLGLGEPVFLGLPDGASVAAPGAAARLAAALHALAPQVLFAPWPADPHPDHRGAARLLVEAARLAGLAPATPCWAYEVWCPLVANGFVDVTAVMPLKHAAIDAYQSQIAGATDYRRVIDGLNAYRSLAAGYSKGYAEAFHLETLAGYAALVAALAGSRSRR